MPVCRENFLGYRASRPAGGLLVVGCIAWMVGQFGISRRPDVVRTDRGFRPKLWDGQVG